MVLIRHIQPEQLVSNCIVNQRPRPVFESASRCSEVKLPVSGSMTRLRLGTPSALAYIATVRGHTQRETPFFDSWIVQCRYQYLPDDVEVVRLMEYVMTVGATVWLVLRCGTGAGSSATANILSPLGSNQAWFPGSNKGLGSN